MNQEYTPPISNGAEIPIQPELSPEQKEAFEFNKMASKKDLDTKKAHIIMSSLAIGGEHVSPLFTSPQRKDLEDKLAEILKSL
jgi:hypothetical protein